MSTDRSPEKYWYISHRLLALLKAQDESTRALWRPNKVGLSLGPATGEIAHRDETNPFRLAQEVTELVSDLTGDLEQPGIYVRTTALLRLGRMPVLRGEAATRRYEMAMVVGEANERSGECSFVLFGSLGNYAGTAAEIRSAPPPLGWFPSDDAGFEMYMRALAYGDESNADYHLVDDQHVEESSVERALAVARTAGDPFLKTLLLETLFLVFDQGAVTESGRRHVSFVGTPLWIRSPSPQPDIPAEKRSRWFGLMRGQQQVTTEPR